MSRPRLLSLLGGDPLQRAQRLAEEGKKAQAAAEFARGGDFYQAGRLAAEAGDEGKAIEYLLRGGLGQVPSGYGEVRAEQAGELLAASGFHKEAVVLFELAKAHRKTAESLLKLQQLPRAARAYERARAWPEAALYYERTGMLQDALRVLELDAQRLRQEGRARRDPGHEEKANQVDLRRADILARLGRREDAATLLRGSQATPQSARMLEEAGQIAQAIEAYLQLGETGRVLALLPRARDLDRTRAAQILLRCNRPLEAANLFAALGMSREAAEAFELAAEWVKAGASWEEVREPLRAAQCYLRAERQRDAARSFAIAGKHQLAAAALVHAGDRAGAAAAYLRAGQPLDAAPLLLATGDKAGAARALMQVQPTAGDYREATLLLAPILIEEGQLEEALRRLRTLTAPLAGLPRPGAAGEEGAQELLYWEGRALEGLGRATEAAQRYQKVLERVAPGGSAAAVAPLPGDAARRLAALHSEVVAAAASPPASLRQAPPPAPPLSAGAAGAAGAAEAPTLREAAGAVRRPPRESHEAAHLAPGDLLVGRYAIAAELGRGGMGRVYKALDREINEVVAIKTLLTRKEDEATEQERLLRELQICRKVTHPNVVRVFDLGRFDGGVFITMEYLEGERLDRLVARRHPLPLAEARQLLRDIVSGLREAHALGIVHRDLKPGNVIVTPGRVKLLDFGLARMAGLDSRLTQTGFAVGTPMYMSPEQLQGSTLDPRSDLYSLGILSYFLIAGTEPFNGTTPTALALQHLQAVPPDIRRYRPDLPAAWLPFLARLLAKLPAQRFPSAEEVATALAALPVEAESRQ